MKRDPIIFDSSALLALILKEKGMEIVAEELKRSDVHMTTVNIAEVVGKLLREGYVYHEVRSLLPAMPITIVEVDEAMAYVAGSYDPYTRKFGLSLGDRICLAASSQLGYVALSSDQIWKKLKLENVSLRFIR